MLFGTALGREAQEYRKPDIAVAQLRNDAGVAETSGSPGGNSGRFKRDPGKKILRPWCGWDGTTSSAGPDLAGAGAGEAMPGTLRLENRTLS